MQLHWIPVVLLAACGDNFIDPVDPIGEPLVATCDEAKLEDTLAALPGVTSAVEVSCGDFVAGTPRCFAIDFDQPIQHANPDGPHFTQKLWLAHRSCDRPTLVGDWGYSQDYFFDDELSRLYEPNALWIEHRFQGASIPPLAQWDWTALTIENGAADMHEIIAAFRGHYGDRFVSTGASKGGITATYHAYSYPDDLDGAIPYVAPASRARVDPRYQTRLQTAFPEECSQRVRDVQTAALTTRRSFVLQKLTPQAPGSEALLLEYSVSRFDWGFWQYWGVDYCNQVPTAASSDDRFWQFFSSFSGLGFGKATPPANDEYSNGALYYEWLTQQGFALQINAEVEPLLAEPLALATMEDDFHGMFPTVELPRYNGSLTGVVRQWAKVAATDLLLIYGDYDPWSGGAMDAPERPGSGRFFVPNATHGAQISDLSIDDRNAALAIASRMFGHEPVAGKPSRPRSELERARDHQRDFAIGWQMKRWSP
jgi:hypothetical protein